MPPNGARRGERGLPLTTLLLEPPSDLQRRSQARGRGGADSFQPQQIIRAAAGQLPETRKRHDQSPGDLVGGIGAVPAADQERQQLDGR
jgi:hypothetical protein